MIIKKNREFCVYIGMEIQFKTFTDTSIENYVQFVNDTLDENEIFKLLSFDDYILLMTFYDMSGIIADNNGFPYFSEELDSVYADFKSRLLSPSQSGDFIKLKNNYNKIIQGMERCGQKKYVEKLQKIMECHNKSATSLS